MSYAGSRFPAFHVNSNILGPGPEELPIANTKGWVVRNPTQSGAICGAHEAVPLNSMIRNTLDFSLVYEVPSSPLHRGVQFLSPTTIERRES
jgi:hypothetical protein